MGQGSNLKKSTSFYDASSTEYWYYFAGFESPDY
jgi:hypothetical protein